MRRLARNEPRLTAEQPPCRPAAEIHLHEPGRLWQATPGRVWQEARHVLDNLEAEHVARLHECSIRQRQMMIDEIPVLTAEHADVRLQHQQTTTRLQHRPDGAERREKRCFIGRCSKKLLQKTVSTLSAGT